MGGLSSDTERELWRAGVRWYQPSTLEGQLDCPHLRPVQEQLAAGVTLISRLDEYVEKSVWTALSSAWHQCEPWLRMAAGLAFVDVELSAFDAPYMCSGAMDYDEAEDRSASLVMTEYTRLLYTWNATEVFVRAIDLPDPAGGKSALHCASRRISDECASRSPDHYDYLLSHLVQHVNADSWLKDDEGLQHSMKLRPWRTRAAKLFAMSAQLRHVAAHGALRLPQPGRWGADWPDDEEPISLRELHVPQIGTRGLMLGLQTIVASLIPAEVVVAGDDLPSLVGDGIEGSDVALRDVLWNLHLVPY